MAFSLEIRQSFLYHNRVNPCQNRIAPILLIGFNRPDFIRALIDRLGSLKPSKIYFAVDGPRPNCPDDLVLVEEVRASIQEIDWPCSIKTFFRDVNRGCKYGPSEAITWFFSNEERGVILEDDCQPSDDFLLYASELLERYRNDNRIGAICGSNPFSLQTDKETSYHFSRRLFIWGWASWRRVWDDYDVELAEYRVRIPQIAARYSRKRYIRNLLANGALAACEGRIQTWDMQLCVLFAWKRYLSIVPKVQLTANLGLGDANATHTGNYTYFAKLHTRTCGISFPLKHPVAIEQDIAADSMHDSLDAGVLPRLFTWLGAKFPVLIPIIVRIGTFLEHAAPWMFRI